MRTFAIFTGLAALILLSGCIAIPIPTGQEAPFKKEDLPALETATSTRADVLFALGEPDVVYGDERLFLYTKLQTHFVWLVAVGAYYTAKMGIIPGSQTRHALGIWFDGRGRMNHMEAIPLRESQGASNVIASDGKPNDAPRSAAPPPSTANCFQNGACFATQTGTAIYAAPDDARMAGPRDTGTCRLTLFVNCGPACQRHAAVDPASVTMKLDGWPIGPYVKGGYYAFAVPPGRHFVGASGRERGLFVLEHEHQERQVICKPPAPLHLRVDLLRKMPNRPPFEFERVNAEAAAAEIGYRRRLMRRWHSNSLRPGSPALGQQHFR
jgi:hypothetical protein